MGFLILSSVRSMFPLIGIPGKALVDPPVYLAALQIISEEPVVLCHFKMNVVINFYTVEGTTLICQGPEVAN